MSKRLASFIGAGRPRDEDDTYPWFREGRALPSRRDLLAEAAALVALLFALGMAVILGSWPG